MKVKNFAYLLLASAIVFSGCGEVEEPPLVIVDSEDDVVSYSLVQATIEDVVKTAKIDCYYSQTTEQEVCFDVTGKYVDKVYVKSGDTVKKGDLLCELSSSQLEVDIEDLEYNIKKNEKQLEYLDRNEALTIQSMYAEGKMPGDAIIEYGNNLKKQNDKIRQSINDSLEFDRMELSAKRTELKNSRLYATMDGVVYKVKDYLEGSTSKKDEVIMTIVDNTNCVFEVRNTDTINLFEEGELVYMKINYSSASGEYDLLPFEMDKWAENGKMQFSVFTKPENAVIEVGAMGSIKITEEQKQNVLSVPSDVVHIAGDEAFVYTLTPDNVREIRYVNIGLVGDERTEILDGLTEGEKVVKK